MYTFKQETKQATLTQTKLSWPVAVAKAIEAITQILSGVKVNDESTDLLSGRSREYNEEQDSKLYMYNPVGSEPIPLDELEHVLESRGAARIEDGHHIQLMLTLNGTTAWEGIIWRE